MFLALVCLSLAAVQGWGSYSSRATDLREANTSTVNMARALSDHAEASIDLVGTILSSVVERFQAGELGNDRQRFQRFLVSMTQRTPSLQGLHLYDAAGNWVLNSLPATALKGNNADREYFIYHRTHTDLSPRLGNPLRSRFNGVWVLPVSRRLDNPDGSFAGVALATIEIDFFRKFYESFNIGEKGTIFLALDTGSLVVRRPFREKDIGLDISGGPVFTLWKQSGEPTGSAILVARIDHVERLYTYRHLRQYPLLIAVALSKQEVLARWRTDTIASAAGTLILLAALLWLGARMIRQMIQTGQLQRELRDAKTALEANNAALQLLALSDGLTGLANRRHFDQSLDAEFKRAMRDGSPLALVMFDVDYFKKFNDQHGHVQGDAALQMVSRAMLAGQRRPADVAARFGGEEFAMLLPDTEPGGALAVAESIRAAIAAAQFPHGASPFRILTISAGVHSMIPQRGQNARALVEAADRGLYRAKAQGRNSVCAEQLEDASQLEA
ncbi:sensor domain-containing diguanylate cyclase [Massilia psychrophila]|nr:sensor domain-containing diguanylate cyclase [Massilia psychrophila]GGE79349.1 sensor domain-containing diguanylate cyclase [Massilia psychrophila]